MSISAIAGGTPVGVATPGHQQETKPSVQPQPAKVETVSISKQAQQLANDGDTADQEVRESASEQGSEKLKGKK